MSAAKWHRERVRSEDSIHRIAVHEGIYFADEARAESAHHATAADALEALAVPGVARIVDLLVRGYSVDEADRVPEVRAALSRLAKIASEGK